MLHRAAMPPTAALVSGDARRPGIGRVVFWSLLLAGAFEAFAWVVKEVHALGSHAPWADDPYDVATSFAIFFVPLLVLVTATRIPLCRRLDPLPLARVRALLRSSAAIVAIVLVTLLADWVSVVVGANEASWSPATPWLVVVLCALSLLTLPVLIGLRRTTRQLPVAARNGSELSDPDWLADLLELTRRTARRLGWGSQAAAWAADQADRRLVDPIRRHPIATAAAAAAVFAVALAEAAAREDGIGPVLGLVLSVAWCGMFGFLVVASAWLDLVRPASPLVGWHRRLVASVTLACVAVLLALAFRDSLWWATGTTGAGLPDVARLLALTAGATFGITLLAQTVADVGARRDR
jgi:hypothetical protein